MQSSSAIESSAGKRLVALDLDPSKRQLRQFGLALTLLLPFVVWLILGRPWLAWSDAAVRWMTIATGVGVASAIVAILRPRWLRPIYVALCIIAYPIGLIIGEAVLFLVYLLVFTPVALCFRLIGRDALALRIDRQRSSYWTAKRQPSGPGSYLRQS